MTVKLKRQRQGKMVDVDVEVYTPNTQRPLYIDRNVTLIEGQRYARRPSVMAKKAGKRTAGELFAADGYEGGADDWATAEPMPYEHRLEDCGWEPGLIVRQKSAFTGPKPGPTDEALKADTGDELFVDSQLTPAFWAACVRYTKAHAMAYRRARPAWRRRGTIEMSMRDERRATVDAMKLWLAAKIRVAQFKQEIPAIFLWDPSSTVYDAALAQKLGHKQYLWFNRHASFADVSSAANQASPGESAYDRHRKWRELCNVVRQAMAAAWNPHQACGLDDCIRANKHRGRRRVRYKAAVHSGCPVDMLNDAVTHYTMWFEETDWLTCLYDAATDMGSLLERCGARSSA